MDGIAGRLTEETLGVVRGTAMWARRITKNSMGGIRQFNVNGLQDIDDGLSSAKEQASRAMEAQAAKLGADAILGLRLDVVEMSSGAFCVNVTGTAVKTAKLPQSIPAFASAVEEAGSAMPFLAARASFEGSSLRH